MNALSTYLEKNNLSPTQFAKLNGLKQPTIWRIINLKYKPNPQTAQKIQQATGGAVTVMELLFPEANDKGRGAQVSDKSAMSSKTANPA